MALTFRKATKEQAKLRLALIGPAGSGKTYTALKLATSLGNKVALIDTEHGSASKYADQFEFDTLELEDFAPANYSAAIKAAKEAGYEVLVIDSLSHAWAGKGGALEMVDQAAKRYQGNSFAAWRDVTPEHNRLVETMLASNLHLIVTMRTKMEYVVEKDEKGKTTPRKIGLAPIQRDGLEYEFDVVGDMDQDNNLIITKTRCSALAGKVIVKPGEDLAQILKAWLNDGVAPGPHPTLPQLKRLFAMASEAGLKEADIKKILADEYKHESTKELTLEEYEKFCTEIQKRLDQKLAAQEAPKEAAVNA